jgi:enediyne biosynthesis protein E4
METAALWKSVEKSRSDFPTASHRAWKTLRQKRSEFPTVPTASANDGHADLFVTGYLASTLFHNQGNGTFCNVSSTSGVENRGKWAASAAWLDYDRDGYLDLFVCNYAELSFSNPKRCQYEGKPTYCEQKAYPGQVSVLYRNQREGTFRDVTARAGIHELVGRALGVVSADFNNDSLDGSLRRS